MVRLQRSITCTPSSRARMHQPAEMRIELGRAAGDVERRDAPALEQREHEVDRSRPPSPRCGSGPAFDVAMHAGLVAAIADIDLQRVEPAAADRRERDRFEQRPGVSHAFCHSALTSVELSHDTQRSLRRAAIGRKSPRRVSAVTVPAAAGAGEVRRRRSGRSPAASAPGWRRSSPATRPSRLTSTPSTQPSLTPSTPHRLASTPVPLSVRPT